MMSLGCGGMSRGSMPLVPLLSLDPLVPILFLVLVTVGSRPAQGGLGKPRRGG